MSAATDALWTAYAAAARESNLQRGNWRMAGGTPGEAIFAFQKYYAADQAATKAYEAYLAAAFPPRG